MHNSISQLRGTLSKALAEAHGQESGFGEGGDAALGREASSDAGEGPQDLDFVEEKDLLWNIQASCVSLLVSSFSGVIAASLSHIQADNLKKAALLPESQGRKRDGPNSNIVALRRSLRHGMCVASLFLTAPLCRFVWDKLAQAVICKFHGALEQLKALTPVAAEALLRDAEALHAALLDLPAQTFLEGADAGKNTKRKLRMPAGYEKFVSREMERAEAALRVAAFPPEDGAAPMAFAGASSLLGRASSSTAKAENTVLLPMKEAKIFAAASPAQASSSSPSF
ncbi:Vps53 family, N-terminal protein [Toxoplasma gondii TgCatPRC2]|nr:Vps53 family, N-terminal protein [Toxoplasma gondii TgCatPRC2]RQX67443.1 Vps53 family, N-terminal protein [Toxoplasma gondii CAST]